MSESESLVCPNCSERSPAGYILCPYCGFDLTKILKKIHRRPITFKERFSRIWRSVSDPRLSKILFREISVNPDRIGVIFLLYFLSVAYATRIGAFMIKSSDSSWRSFEIVYFLVQPWFSGFIFFFLALFGWTVVTLIIWLVAKTLGGKAGLRDTFSIVGYSFGPLVTASLIFSVVVIILGAPINGIVPTTTENYGLFEIIYLPFLAIVAYHCGNGLHSSHLLNPTYSYILSGAIAGLYGILYLIPLII
ncbi:MAG: YIP1 family protein [Candidatus Hodarchaeales archaeon]